MSVFNLIQQNASLDSKIVAGLERLSQVFKILLWEKAKAFGLSPIQIQLMIFIRHHDAAKATIGYLAQEFNLTPPTISDAIKILEQKKLIQKISSATDSRSYTIKLSAAGLKIVAATEDFADPVRDLITAATEKEKIALWNTITGLILNLHKTQLISVQRTCFNCKHYLIKNKISHCSLLDTNLLSKDIRIDCPEFALS